MGVDPVRGRIERTRKNLKDSLDSFNGLRKQIFSEYRETVQRRYFTVTGENPDDKIVYLLIPTAILPVKGAAEKNGGHTDSSIWLVLKKKISKLGAYRFVLVNRA
jgi:hypothetical protein